MNEIIIKEEDFKGKIIQKHFIELIIKDILSANPQIERFKDDYIMLNKENTIITKYSSINYYSGFRTTFIETDRGKLLNVGLTYKYKSNETILDYLNKFVNLNDKSNQEEINKQLIGHSIRVSFTKRKYQIDEILFDKNPINQVVNYQGRVINLINYYEMAFGIKIFYKKQPLILARKDVDQCYPYNLYLLPEFCYFEGNDSEDIINSNIIKKISKEIKFFD